MFNVNVFHFINLKMLNYEDFHMIMCEYTYVIYIKQK